MRALLWATCALPAAALGGVHGAPRVTSHLLPEAAGEVIAATGGDGVVWLLSQGEGWWRHAVRHEGVTSTRVPGGGPVVLDGSGRPHAVGSGQSWGLLDGTARADEASVRIAGDGVSRALPARCVVLVTGRVDAVRLLAGCATRTVSGDGLPAWALGQDQGLAAVGEGPLVLWTRAGDALYVDLLPSAPSALGWTPFPVPGGLVVEWPVPASGPPGADQRLVVPLPGDAELRAVGVTDDAIVVATTVSLGRARRTQVITAGVALAAAPGDAALSR